MKYFKLGLLTMLVSLFLFSCKNPDSVGLDIAPEDQIVSTLVDTSTVLTTTVKEDAVLTSNLSQQPLGLLQDPTFGKTEANIALSLALPRDSSQVRFGNSPVLDSAVLVLKYGNEFFGDSVSSSYTVNLYQLDEKYNSSMTYNNDKEWTYNATAIGSKNVSKFRLKDSVRVNEVIRGKSDVVKKVFPHLRIPVSSAFINTNFLNAGADNFSSNTKFANFLKGLYLRVDKTGAGGIAFFMPDSSRLELYYKRQVGSAIDTNVIRFPVTASASNTKHDYAGTPVETQLNSPTVKFESVFVQPLGGVRTKVRFPYLQNLKNLGNIVVNKAELVIYTDQTAATPFSPAPRLTLYRTDIAGQRQEVPDNDIGQVNGYGDQGALDVAIFGGFFDKSKKRYVFNISSYIQNIISGKMQQYDTYLAAIKFDLPRNASSDRRVTDLYPSGTTAAHSVLGSGTNTTYKMKLNIYYTRLGQ